MSRFPFRRAVVAVAGVVVFAACSKDAPSADSAAALARAPAAAKAMPGALTKPIDAYSGDEFYAFVQKLDFSGGQTRERNCKNNPACDGPTPSKHTTVQVDAVTTQDSIAPSTVPQNGVVYVRALNKGDAEEARYGMLPGSNIAYYLIVTADAAKKAMQWRLEMLDNTPNARRHASVGSGQFVGCAHKWTAGAKADFKTCANAASGRDSVLHLGLTLQGVTGVPIWAACADGCCIGS